MPKRKRSTLSSFGPLAKFAGRAYKTARRFVRSKRRSVGYGSTKRRSMGFARTKRRGSSRNQPYTSDRTGYPGKTVAWRIGRFRRGKNPSKFRRRILKAIVPVDHYNIVQWASWTWGDNQSGFFVVGDPLFANAHLTAIANVVPQTYGSAPGLTNTTTLVPHDASRFDILNARKHIQCSNASTQIVNLRVYKCKIRRDWPNMTSLAPLVNQILAATVAAGTGGILSKGFGDAEVTNTLSFSGMFLDVESTLFMNPQFCSWAKILSVKHYKLAPGENKDFDINYNKSRYVNTEIISAADFLYTKPTYFYVFQPWGEVVNTAVTQTVGYSIGKLDFITKYYYDYSYIVNNRSTLSYTNGLPAPTGTSQFVNPDTDVVQAEGTA